jgi:hypothetical protein
MSNENELAESTEQQGAGADDLNATLGESETEFVVGDEKKQPLSAGTLVVGGLIAVAGLATYFMSVRNGPKAVSANPSTASANATITQFLSNDSQNAERMRQLLKDTEKAVQQFKQQPAKTQIPLDDLKTNPFRAETAATNDAAEKALEKQKKEETLKAVSALRVQSIMSGGKRKAVMINNTLYTEGESVQGFQIEKISSDAVIVKNSVGRFALKMQK